jgi:nicotinate-nucleotide adenylyltransferase
VGEVIPKQAEELGLGLSQSCKGFDRSKMGQYPNMDPILIDRIARLKAKSKSQFFSLFGYKRRIGIFGGTFDPPHHGHIHLIVSLKERHALDEVWIIPAQQNPLKLPVCTAFHRLRMSQLAFSTIPGTFVLDTESFREGPSYTIDTVCALLTAFPLFCHSDRFLLLGADLIPSLREWKEIDTLLTLVHPLVAARGRCEAGDRWSSRFESGWTDTGLLDISSTDVRQRLSKGLYVDHLIPNSVITYIHENRLYGVL